MSSPIFQSIESLIQLSMVMMVGLYFVFSNAIMPSLKQMESGADVMAEINKVILNPVFMAVFMLSGIGSLYLVLVADGLLAISGAVFLIGTTLVTMIKNVPLNNELRDAGEERCQVWQHYLRTWVFWNHVRTVSAVISGLLLVV